jgi:hypothetical protein
VYRCVDIIKVNLTDEGCGGMWLTIGTAGGLLGFVKCSGLEQLHKWRVVEEGSCPWRYLAIDEQVILMV